MSTRIELAKGSSSGLTDVKIVIKFENAGTQAIEIYPALAQLRERGGWPGPFWDIEFLDNGKEVEGATLELRSGNGPPGTPPAGEYWDSNKVTLGPTSSQEHVIAACWIPRRMLRPAQLSKKTLDPDGVDGLGESKLDFGRSSVLVWERECKDVRAAMRERSDFLRPGVITFLSGRGPFELRVGYSQDSHSFCPSMVSGRAQGNALEFKP